MKIKQNLKLEENMHTYLKTSYDNFIVRLKIWVRLYDLKK